MQSVQEITFTDHRPVCALFDVTTVKFSRLKAIEMEEKYFQSMRFQSFLILPEDVAPRSRSAEKNIKGGSEDFQVGDFNQSSRNKVAEESKEEDVVVGSVEE